MVEFIKFLLENIVEHPEEITVEETTDDIGNVLLIKANDKDKALIIGKNGRNIKAIRSLASIISKREGKRIFIKIAD